MWKHTVSILCVLAAFILISDRTKFVSAAPAEKYTTKYDNFDISRVVKSRRLMQNYANCLLDKGPCTPEGKELKAHLPDAIQTQCSKCNEKQKQMAGIILAHVVENYKDLWDAILVKYDPDGKFRREYEGNFEEDEDEEEDE